MPKDGLSKGTSRYALKTKEEKLHLKFKKLSLFRGDKHTAFLINFTGMFFFFFTEDIKLRVQI